MQEEVKVISIRRAGEEKMAKVNYFKGNEKSEITQEELQTEIAQYLQIDNLSFLLGAGCSSNIVNGKETGVPGMAVLYNDFFDKNPKFSISKKVMKGEFEKNLEKLLEVMGAVQVVNPISKVDDDIDDKILQVQSFIRNQIQSGLNGQEVKDIYKGFYTKITQRSRKSPISIFTTNYDLFNEIALDELGFPYNNGFTGTYRRKFNPISYNYMYVDNMNLNRDIWERVSTFLNLIKLHGSISWVRKDDEIWEQDYKVIQDNEPVMIYPTPLKDRTTLMTPYSDLFRVMENNIVQRNSVLIVLGYSFSDDHINRVILNGLAVPSFRLIVFGSGQNISKLITLGDSRITVVNSDDKIHYFKNFVEKVLPSVHPDVEEVLKKPSVNRLVYNFEQEAKDE